MPVQEARAKLWFNTEAERETYDDLMISNIELKEGDDPNSPHFSYLAARARKEKFPTYSQKFYDGLATVMAQIPKEEERRANYSYRFWHEFTLEKYFVGLGLTYLILRELPIRNFYARSLIMGIIGIRFYNNYRFRGINSPTMTTMIIDEDPELAL